MQGALPGIASCLVVLVEVVVLILKQEKRMKSLHLRGYEGAYTVGLYLFAILLL